MSNDDGSCAHGGDATYVADESTLAAFFSREGHTVTGVLVDPYGTSTVNLPMVASSDRREQSSSTAPSSLSSSTATTLNHHSPQTRQTAITLLRSLGPIELAKQRSALSDATRTALQTLDYPPQRASAQENMNRFFARCKSNAEHVLMYEDLDLRMYALSVIPMDELTDRACALHDRQPEQRMAFGDCFYRELGRWFKSSFFKWTNAAPCAACGKATTLVGRAQPTQEERRWHAGTVEVYKCNTCQSQTRFPRYNHPRKLLETRQGRCGEWANAFTLLCRACGFDARQVHDWTDHVWTETFSPHFGRWVHFDSCENACDSPLMYESGWGKKLTYIVAISRDDVTDVTTRYTNKFVELQRYLFPESWLRTMLETMDLEQRINCALREASTLDRWDVLTARRQAEQAELVARRASEEEREALTKARADTAAGSGSGSSSKPAAEKRGRVSGSAAWRSQRGELGSGEAKRLALVAEEQEENDEAAGTSALTSAVPASAAAAAASPPAATSAASQLKARVQELFAANVAAGMDANVAAAQAVAIAKAEVSNTTATIRGGGSSSSSNNDSAKM